MEPWHKIPTPIYLAMLPSTKMELATEEVFSYADQRGNLNLSCALRLSEFCVIL